MDLDNKINNLLERIELIIQDDYPSIYVDDSSIGVYEYWGFVKRNRTHLYAEISEEYRYINIDIYFTNYEIQEIINKNICYYVIDDYYELKYNYSIKNIIQDKNNNSTIEIKWGELEKLNVIMLY